MARLRQAVAVAPAPVEVPSLALCVVEDWAPPDDPMSEYESRQPPEYLTLVFARRAQHRWLRARRDAGAPRRWSRPQWRTRPYPEQDGWFPTVGEVARD